MRYPVAVHKDDASDYGVTVPDLPGCFSAGRNVDEALDAVREAIMCHIEGLLLDGDPIPARHTLEELRTRPEYSDALWAMVDIDLAALEGKSERVNITLPTRILALVDTFAKSHHESRSGFLARAALEVVTRESKTA